MTIYHGSDHIIEKPEYGRGGYSNDFGRGFYCTESLQLAKEWACAKNSDGYANMYELDMSGLAVLNLNGDEYGILNWLALLTRYRSYWQQKSIAEQAKEYLQKNFLPDISGYDVIVGYRADDSYFSFAQDFIMGTISLAQLGQAMHLGKLGEQIVLKSRRAFDRLSFLSYEEADAAEYFLKKTQRDREARKEYRRLSELSAEVDDIYMIDIMRGGMKNGDVCLR
ncbi:putative uncharacterized protein [Firmicutes bacterium CAG:882]|nr:putative uncharacterized protein [Firmicutes bacterium CAG:882]